MALLSFWEERNQKRRPNSKRCYPFSDLLADLQNELISELRDLPCIFSEDLIDRKRAKLGSDEGNLIELEETKHYEPEELTVKLKGRQVEVSGKHEEKSQEGESYVYREFRRSFQLPKDADPESVTSELSSDGVLRIRASPLRKEKCIKITVEKDDSDTSKCEKKECGNKSD